MVLYTIRACPFCVKAKELLVERGVPFEEIDLSDRPEALALLKTLTGWKTVPQIFVNGHLIGGYEELRMMMGHAQRDELSLSRE